jgi:hypothetical protein
VLFGFLSLGVTYIAKYVLGPDDEEVELMEQSKQISIRISFDCFIFAQR